MDKREAVRVPVRVAARCRTDSGVVIGGLVEDVSRSGAFVAVDSFGIDEDPVLAEGSSTFVAFELPNESIQLEATVVRRESSGVGLKFVEPNRRDLANFIMAQAHRVRH